MKKAIGPAIFKWRQTEPKLILRAVRWYLRYSLSFRDAEELLSERDLAEALHMIRKGQARGVSGSDVRRQIQCITSCSR